MIISPAYAQAAGETAGGAAQALQSFLPIILIFVVFYFLLIRPQQKRMKEQKQMLNGTRRGDRVVFGGGIIGSVQKVIDDNELLVEIAEGVRVRAQRAMIATVLTKGEPVRDGEPPASGGGSGKGELQSGEPARIEQKPASGSGGLGRLFGGKNK